ncbi:hypothetical protein CEV32_0927 [Brucella rhizosphaerae]|uniref:Uncharacterized protein n=1 Tax=Brucella rhizosphaerae TaxID=571254 RepID=A0A256FD83_9HYPH|nr:hypothetical protein CEV32_0927 [Brucella rhizosphaerae]
MRTATRFKNNDLKGVAQPLQTVTDFNEKSRGNNPTAFSV